MTAFVNKEMRANLEPQAAPEVVSPTAEDILAQEPPTRATTIPGLGPILIKGLSNEDLTWCRAARRPDGTVDEAEFGARVVQRAVCDLKGKRIFTVIHVAKLRISAGKWFLPVYEIAAELSGLSESSRRQIEKNSETPAQTAGESGSLSD